MKTCKNKNGSTFHKLISRYNLQLIFLMLTVAGLAASCSSADKSGNGMSSDWRKIHKTLTDSSEGVIVNISYTETYDIDFGVNYTFNLEVLNMSGKLITVDPDKFYYIPQYGNREIPASSIPAIRADELIASLKAERKTEESGAWVSFCGGICISALCSAIFQKDVPPPDNTEEDSKRQERITQLERMEDYYTNHLLRLRNIKPGGMVKGDVLFPVQKSTKEIAVYLPIDGKVFNFEFDILD